MSFFPDFVIRRIYKKGSLKKEGNTITFLVKNELGPDFISGLSYIKINDMMYGSDKVRFITQGKEINGAEVSEENQVIFRLGQEGKFILDGTEGLVEGKNRIEIEVKTPKSGKMGLTIEDVFSE